MSTTQDSLPPRIRGELLYRAIGLGEELIRLSDDLGLAVAGLHICQGVEVMREEADRLLSRT
ncbi:hypothetical protein [Sphingomonas melonis]|jgi:hypothetical protein|uniref:Uncharacterized protein n=1 Tax=Sphingomonas melonis TaxID=152682 RepID=A0A7Y9FPS9_9SPHN|nr:hypothetical protein [Sphingomonas melonis]NYD90817.1 hypothetical protein [Sphingomonas melonis]